MKKKPDEKTWRDILAEINGNVTDVSYRTWFKPIVPLEIDEDARVFHVAASDNFVVEVLNNRYIPIFEQAVESVLNERYRVVIKEKSSEEIESIINGTADSRVHAPKKEKAEEEFKEEYFLNPRYKFDNFVVGSNNNYAHAIALSVAESPASAYNPLFLYGGSGLGKTHLMHAIGHYILENNPSSKVLYVSSEMFTSELVKAIQDKKNYNSKMRFFKNKYRNVDVLLIDDIQFIEGKESTQVEFFHTFNALYECDKQIVISSDRHPSKLTDLDERLRSRFQWNVIADIQPPDFETRVAILRNKAQLEKIDLEDDDILEVIDLIAEKVKYNIRELESALTRIISYSKIFSEPITVKFAKKNLSDIFSNSDLDISCESIKKSVCKKYNIKVADIESAKRKREFSHPRQVAMYLCRELTDSSLPKIGNCFGGRDHTTVLHAYEKISEQLKTDNLLNEEIRRIKDDL